MIGKGVLKLSKQEPYLICNTCHEEIRKHGTSLFRAGLSHYDKTNHENFIAHPRKIILKINDKLEEYR
ncbi:MAG: hypothetical protein K5785_00810 [Nitrosarchaeum sp.]|nr:hypothetical protein [Nitrosarchaeum sp.]